VLGYSHLAGRRFAGAKRSLNIERYKKARPRWVRPLEGQRNAIARFMLKPNVNQRVFLQRRSINANDAIAGLDASAFGGAAGNYALHELGVIRG